LRFWCCCGRRSGGILRRLLRMHPSPRAQS
jgi:hypothetical protein